MATQASISITFYPRQDKPITTEWDLQFYFGYQRIAMVVICVTFIPIYHRLKFFYRIWIFGTTFRFKSRTLASIYLWFNVDWTGLTIYAASIILSTLHRLELNNANIIIGILVICLRILVVRKPLTLLKSNKCLCERNDYYFSWFYIYFPTEMTVSNALLHIAGYEKKWTFAISHSIQRNDTLWSGIAGGFFLSLAILEPINQVGRYLSGKSDKKKPNGINHEF
jgi:hypothetical protein